MIYVTLGRLRKNGYTIKYIENPTIEEQLVAVSANGCAIQYINEPSEEIQLAAINNEADAIKYIKDPSEEIKRKAVRNKSTSIKYIKNPSKDIQLLSIRQDPKNIHFIENPCKDAVLEALKHGVGINNIESTYMTKVYIKKFFSVLTEDELFYVLQEIFLYRNKNEKINDAIKWAMTFGEEHDINIYNRIVDKYGEVQEGVDYKIYGKSYEEDDEC